MPRSSFLKRNDNIIKFHKQIQINIGLIIFGIIFIYVLFHIFSYMTSDNITVYEVTGGDDSHQNYILSGAGNPSGAGCQRGSSGDIF